MEEKSCYPGNRNGDFGNINGRNLSCDLFMQIISLLPAKSLFRFKCVSKAWQSLISDKAFERIMFLSMSGLFYGVSDDSMNLSTRAKEWKYTFMSGDKSGDLNFPDMSFSFVPRFPDFNILDSCNGLILCLCGKISENPFYYVCNPLTKRWVILPKSVHIKDSSTTAKLVFDPSLSPHYKVILLLGSSGNPPDYVFFKIFSSNSIGKWVESRVLCPGFVHEFKLENAVLLNGDLYIPSYPHLLKINLNEASCQVMEMHKKQSPQGAFGKYGGNLHFTNNDGMLLLVWMLKNSDGNDWVLKHIRSNKDLARKTPQAICLHSMLLLDPLDGLAFHPDFEVVIVVTHCKIFSYHLLNSRLEEICGFTCSSENSYHKSIFPYTPCLNSFLDTC